MTCDDRELLRRYVRNASGEAFEELVKRHSSLVYSAALRKVGTPELAQEVAQSVFVRLAEKAGRLSSKVILSGWLYRTTWYVATKMARSERRRRIREEESISMNNPTGHGESVWRQVEPHLDDAMEELAETDRTALVLRYLENRSLRELGEVLGTSEDAAQKRVARALDRLRSVFARRRVGVSSAALAGAMSTFGIQAAPAALQGTILAATSTVAVGGGLITHTLMNMITFTKTKAAVAAGVAVAATQFAVHEHTERRLIDETEVLRAENAQLLARVSEPEAVDPQLTAEALQWREQAAEVHELRAMVTALQRENLALSEGRDPAAVPNNPAPDADPSNNPMDRMQQAREHVKAGRYAEGLTDLLWCFDEGAKVNPSFVGVRTSFLLIDIAKLGEVYPTAREALVERRNAAESRLSTDTRDRMLILELTRLNDALGEPGRTLELFDALPAGDAGRRAFVDAAFDELLEARRYQNIFAELTPEAYFQDQRRNYSRLRAHPSYVENAALQDSALDMLIRGGGRAVETLAGAGETQRAIDLAALVLQEDNSLETVEDLKRHARRTGNDEVLQYLEGLSR